MELAIVLLVLLAGLVFFVVRPGSKRVDQDASATPTQTPAAPAEDLPSQSSLMRMKKADLEALASNRGVEVSGTKSEIVSRLLP
jgi:hypothetical protein